MCRSNCAEKQKFCKQSTVLHLSVLSRRAKMWSGKRLDICADRTPTSRMRRLGKYNRRGRMSQAPERDFFRYAPMLESCVIMLRKVVLEPSNASGRRVKGANVSHLVILPLKGGRRTIISSNNTLSSLFRLKGLPRNCNIPPCLTSTSQFLIESFIATDCSASAS